ncbi:MAG: aminotransferase class III-fold pyridoxal phosphate-dependent enzyme, partial [Acidimicrobiia bacterium]|nr:aminotransferase class III-fold pyridoxal phosphate-dependent enzyme [Acidimicrobiia bacterium]
HGIVPDMLTFAKGLGNGLAIAGVVARAELMESLQANSISTFGGNPLATAGALANLGYLLEHDLQSNAHKVGQQLQDGLHHLSDEVEEIGEVRGKGLMIGVELVERGGNAPAAALTGRVMGAAREHGLLVGKGGLYGNVLRIAPPLSLTEEEAEAGLSMMRDAITDALPD